MSILPVGLVILIALLCIGYVVWPLINADAETLIPVQEAGLDLIQQKDAALRAIKELDFDYQTGKLSDEDYNRLNNQLRQQTVSIFKQLDKSSPELTKLEDEIEEAITAKRQLLRASSPLSNSA